MPRSSRKLSKSRIYHVMVRGNERKAIFKDDEDRERFLDTLAEKKKENSFYLLAFCLMDNHAHLLIKEDKDCIARIMKRINTSYAYYFNKKYDRVGHVFQDRYKSEVIENEAYLLAAVRYIHNNPVHAQVCASASEYIWSSYHQYVAPENYKLKMVDTQEILELFSPDIKKAVKLFTGHSSQQDDTTFYEPVEQDKEKLSKLEKAKYVINDFLTSNNKKVEDLKNTENKELRNELIKELKKKSGLSIRQIAEVIGVDRNIVQRIK